MIDRVKHVSLLIPESNFHVAFNPLCADMRTVDVSDPVKTFTTIQARAAVWMGQGVSPRRLALTLALGFAMGCIPVVGLPTALCAVIALAFRLNLPAIQVANYVAMPFQAALIVPFLRLGGRILPIAARPAVNPVSLIHSPALLFVHTPQLAVQLGGMAGQALIAWLLIAIPAVLLLTLMLNVLLRRVPALAAAQAAN